MAAVLLLGGCDPSAQEVADQRAKQREAQIEALRDAPVWIGTVTGYDGFLEDKVSVDYGGKYDAEVKVSYVKRVDQYGDDCTSDLGDKGLDTFVDFLHTAAPVGSQVAVIRSGSDRDGGVLLPVTADRKPDTSKASVNERMVAAGAALVDPFARNLNAKADQEVVAAQKVALDPADFAWWIKIVSAATKASTAGTGLVGRCARAVKAEKAADAKAQAKADADIRRWELGPDRRRGTADDYSYGDERERDGSRGPGAGGLGNVPGGMCPTRWC
ncbi:hypothetical protein [Knoellia sp. Soil729]|uniref:hypothetical protein n=1 Tax=Knoellia sp. Soil729 TaxID=1736394 RepID=UPI0012E8AD50|nr:hypothetical protein [Knoellia sp. Soil729]